MPHTSRGSRTSEAVPTVPQPMRRTANSLLSKRRTRQKAATYAAFGCNATYSLANIVLGVWLSSVWFITVGCCFLSLAIMRLCTLKLMTNTGNENGGEKRQRALTQTVGTSMVVLAIVVSGITVLTIAHRPRMPYGEILAIAQATYTFALLGTATYGFVRESHGNSIAGKVLGSVNVVSAAISLFSLQTIMLDTFGASEELRFTATAGLGALVCICCIGMGLRLSKKMS